MWSITVLHLLDWLEIRHAHIALPKWLENLHARYERKQENKILLCKRFRQANPIEIETISSIEKKIGLFPRFLNPESSCIEFFPLLKKKSSLIFYRICLFGKAADEPVSYF